MRPAIRYALQPAADSIKPQGTGTGSASKASDLPCPCCVSDCYRMAETSGSVSAANKARAEGNATVTHPSQTYMELQMQTPGTVQTHANGRHT